MDVKKPIIVVSVSNTSPGVKSLQSAAQDLDYEIKIINPDDPNIIELNNNDKVIFRFGPKNFNKFENLLTKITGKSHQILENSIRAFDKINTYNILSKAGVPIPKSWIIQKDYKFNDIFIIKIPKGNQGLGVGLINSQQKLKEFFDEFPNENEFLAQEYIPEAKSQDKRIFVIGNKVVSAMIRKSVSGDFRANLHLGGIAEKYSPTDEETNIALSAMNAFGLKYAGVDIIDSNHGPLVLEVNPSPGFGISEITNIDVAKELIIFKDGEQND